VKSSLKPTVECGQVAGTFRQNRTEPNREELAETKAGFCAGRSRLLAVLPMKISAPGKTSVLCILQ
jgi:hypothetical protein